MIHPTVVEKNAQMYDCIGWVRVRESFFSRGKTWYMRLHGSTLTLHKSIDTSMVLEYSVVGCEVKTGLFARCFTLKLPERKKLRVSCDFPSEAETWKQSLSKASSTIFQDEFELLEEVEDMGGCTLFSAVQKSDNSKVSVRRIAVDEEQHLDLKTAKSLHRQLYAVRQLYHYTLMGATRVFSEVGYAYMVGKTVGGKRLTQVLSEHGGTLPESMARIITIQLVQALQFMHSKGFVHRKVALESLRFDGSDPSDPRVVLGNFEAVAFVDDEEDLRMRGQVGNAVYQAPEMVRGTSYSASVDMYALGVCVYRMLIGSFPVQGSGIGREGVEEAAFDGESWNNISAEAKSFVKALLKPCYLSRMTAKAAEDDGWFRIDLVDLKEQRSSTGCADVADAALASEKAAGCGEESGESVAVVHRVNKVKADVAPLMRLLSPVTAEAPQSLRSVVG